MKAIFCVFGNRSHRCFNRWRIDLTGGLRVSRGHQCFNRWHRQSAPVKKHMKVVKVADMEVDLVVGKVVNRVAHMVADMDFSIIFWAFFGEMF